MSDDIRWKILYRPPLKPGDGVVDPQEASERFASSLIAEVDRLRAEVGRLRDLDKARLGGISAWCEGMDRESCPYTDASLSSAWCDGWDVQEEAARLRAEIADLRVRLAAETAGDVYGWEWRGYPQKMWVFTDSAVGWHIEVRRDGPRWCWYVDDPSNDDGADGESVLAFDAMCEALAAYERLRGEEE